MFLGYRMHHRVLLHHEDRLWRGLCRLLVVFFRALAKAFARQRAQVRGGWGEPGSGKI